ncbi:hypothetical protein DIPPA_08250 [Diplonema papillatum]|nr:hypothetical protein DIPPA_08250 [Diplonema papillatum]
MSAGHNKLRKLVEKLSKEDSSEGSDVKKLVLDMLGSPKEAGMWLGEEGEFWVDGAPPPVAEALRNLPGDLSAGNWAGAAGSLATIRSLQLVRLTACVAQDRDVFEFPPPPVPRSWPSPLKGAESPAKVHAAVSEDPDGVWSHFALSIALSGRAFVTLLHHGVELTGPVVSTNPEFQQTTGDTEVQLDTKQPTTVLVQGRVRQNGHTTLLVNHPKYDPRTEEGLLMLSAYISKEMRVDERQLLVEYGGERDTALVTFVDSWNAKQLQSKLVGLRTSVWGRAAPSASSRSDVRVEFAGGSTVNLALSGRVGGSPLVDEEVLRQKVAAALRRKACGWRRETVALLTQHPAAGALSLELLWCLVGGCVDLDDPSEYRALLNSVALERHVPNKTPRAFSAHKRHALYSHLDLQHNHTAPLSDTRSLLRSAAVSLHYKILRLLPHVDPQAADNLGIVPPSQS